MTSAKKIIRLTLYLTCGLIHSLLAQPYLSNFNEWTNSRSWIVSTPPQYYAYTHFFVGGDSLINSTVYKKIFRSERYCANQIWVPGQNFPCSAQPSTPVLTALLREVGQRWYLLGAGGQDSLLYRFDLAIGDTVRGANPPCVYIVDTIINNYSQSGRKLFQVRDTAITSTSISGQGILEGVGPTTGFISRLFFAPFEDIEELMCYSALPIPTYCPWFYYLSVGDHDKVNESLIFPNPVSEKLNIKLLNVFGPFKTCLKDAAGRLLFENVYYNTEFSLGLEELKNGLYLLEIKTPDQVIRRRFIKLD